MQIIMNTSSKYLSIAVAVIIVIALSSFVFFEFSNESAQICEFTRDNPQAQGRLFMNEQGPADAIIGTYPAENVSLLVVEQMSLNSSEEDQLGYVNSDKIYVQNINSNNIITQATSDSNGCFDVSTSNLQNPYLCVKSVRYEGYSCFNASGNNLGIRFEYTPQIGRWHTNDLSNPQ